MTVPINLHDGKVKATPLAKLSFHARHRKTSIWVRTQKYNAIEIDFIENIKFLVLFYHKDTDSGVAAFKENDIKINITKKENIIKKLKVDKGSKLKMHYFLLFNIL